jgi:ABC-type transport system substrate-binding protein
MMRNELLHLATSWKKKVTKVGFSIRKGVSFHDGSRFDASAVKYNIEKILIDKESGNVSGRIPKHRISQNCR